MEDEAEDLMGLHSPGECENSRLRTPSCEPLGSEGIAANLGSLVRKLFLSLKIFSYSVQQKVVLRLTDSLLDIDWLKMCNDQSAAEFFGNS